jgi:predicted O-methyltransferase YrrM
LTEPDARDAIAGSDKHYWHRYVDTYLAAFASLGEVRRVVEFGVLRGDSLCWLAACFPAAEIIGVDMLPRRPAWPVHPRIFYRRVDQQDRGAVRAMLAAIDGPIDLIIDDGSHVPMHQATCLAEGMAHVKPGGLYIVEDICTSHPLQPDFAHHSVRNGRRLANALNVLMAIQHMKDVGIARERRHVVALAAEGFFSDRDIAMLFETIVRVEIYKRTQLPLRCYACGGHEFDYVAWRCGCGTELYHPANSMTALVWKG